VYFLPALVDPAALAGKVAVVIDVLRATSTIIQALASGAKEVVPCLEVAEAMELARKCDRAVLGGERGGRQIPGFDLGNSPAEYSPEAVGGKTVIFTTTNGTRALERCRPARRVLIGAFVNFSAVCRELAGEEHVSLVCAGTDGHVTREDALFAGAIVDDLIRGSVARDSVADGPPRSGGLQGRGLQLNDQALLAADAWQAAVRGLTDRPLGLLLRDSRGGRNLIEIGQENDIDLAAQIDRFDIAPQFDPATNRIRL
jgi:2-phosphosulfolactate phosphatase